MLGARLNSLAVSLALMAIEVSWQVCVPWFSTTTLTLAGELVARTMPKLTEYGVTLSSPHGPDVEPASMGMESGVCATPETE